MAAHGLPPVSYNVEIKSDPSKDGILSPDYRTFADLCVRVLQEKIPADRLLVQCFDVRTLNYLHHRYPGLRLSYLVEGDSLDFDACMRRLDFVPQVFSPESRLLSVDVARRARGMGMDTPCAKGELKCYDCRSPQRLCRGLGILMEPMMGMEKAEIVIIGEELGG